MSWVRKSSFRNTKHFESSEQFQAIDLNNSTWKKNNSESHSYVSVATSVLSLEMKETARLAWSRVFSQTAYLINYSFHLLVKKPSSN